MARHFSGRRLRESRKAAGISIELLAIAIERSGYSIHEYERGRVTPPITVIAAIALPLSVIPAFWALDAAGRPPGAASTVRSVWSKRSSPSILFCGTPRCASSSGRTTARSRNAANGSIVLMHCGPPVTPGGPRTE